MTKKRLSDLLKEEASKADTPGEVPAPSDSSHDAPLPPGGEVTRPPIQGRRKTPSSRAKTPKGTATKKTATPSKTTVQPQDKPDTTPPAAVKSTDASPAVTPPTGPTAAELEADLVAVRQEKADLENMVQGLQKDLSAQQSRLFELTDSLDQVKSELEAKTQALHTAEGALADAKATILKLSAPAEKAEKADPRLAAPRRSGGDIVPRQPLPKPASPGYVRGVPTYTPQTEQPNPMLTDADIGWVD